MKKKIKVMMVIWSMDDGGAQKLVYDYLKYFDNDDSFELKLFVYKKSSNSLYDKLIEENKLNVTYINGFIFKKPILRTVFNPIISKITWYVSIKKFKPEIIHAHISTLLKDILIGIKLNKVPVKFATLHSYPKRFTGSYLRSIKKAFNKNEVIPICVTKEQANVAKEYYGISDYELLYNGIDLKNVKACRISKNEARAIFKIEQNKYIIIAAGRLDKIKRFDFLIESFSIAHKKNENALLYIAGEGEEEEYLKKLVIQLGLEKKVYFLGYVENIIQLYCAADMLAITSYSESCSLVLLEAQVCGLSCVVSNGIPSESIVNRNVKKMAVNSSKDDWAIEILNNKYYSNDYIKNKIEDYDIQNNSLKLKKIYIKHWRKYQNVKKIHNNN